MKNGKLVKAIGFMVLSAACSAFMSTCTKMVEGIPAMEKTFFTAVVCMAGSWSVHLRRYRRAPRFERKDYKDLTLRSVYGIISMFLTFWCTSAMDIGDATALFKLAPSFTVIYCHFAMGERFDGMQALLTGAAFAGGMLIVKPNFANADLVPGLAAVLCGAIGGIAHAYIRKLTIYNKVDGNSVILYNYTFSSIVEALIILPVFVVPDLRQLLWMLGAGAFCLLTQISMTAAFTMAAPSEVSVYSYSQIVISSVIGIVLFSEHPDALSVAGYAVITVSAVIMWRYNASKRSSAGAL